MLKDNDELILIRQSAGWSISSYTLVVILILAYILRNTFGYWCFFSLGFISGIGILIYCAIFLKSSRSVSKSTQKPSRFNFVDTKTWETEVQTLFVEPADLDEPIVEESFLISETLEELITLIINEFIDSWFQQISKDTLFQDSIRLELKYVLRNIKRRLSQLDIAKLLVLHILPILNDHFRQFTKAELTVNLKESHTKFPVGSLEYNMAVSRQYNRGKLHPGVTVSINESDINEKNYLRKKIASILPYILSSNETNNNASMSLVREILSCTILSSIFQMLGDGDFYNLIIVKLIGDNLKHREQVKQLRAALEEHTNDLNHKSSLRHISISNPSKQLETCKTIAKESMIRGYMDNHSFTKALKNLLQIENATELKHFLVYTKSQISKSRNKSIDPTEQTVSLLKRLNILKDKTGGRLSQLSSNKGKHLSKNEEMENLLLLDILDNSMALRSFTDFLGLRDRSFLIQLWLAIDSIKAPLEDAAIEDDGESRLSLSLEYSNLEDVKGIYEEFFRNSNQVVHKETIDILNEYIHNNDANLKLELYKKARRSLFKLQGNVYQEMRETDFPLFTKSDLFSKLVEANAFQPKSDELNTFMTTDTPNYVSRNGQMDELNESDNDDVSPVVVRAVEDAFTEIMNNSNDKNEYTSDHNTRGMPSSMYYLSDTASKRPLLTIDLKKDLFGASSNLFEDDIFTYPNNRHPKLFDDMADQSDSDSDSVKFDSDSQTRSLGLQDASHSDLQLFLAAPGNLRLAEEIAKLTEEIDKLSEQQVILHPLLKKAELTNNVGELKILRKSKMSLDKEINAKELQKQQFIVQENDNSLFGKSRVRIQSYISGSENGKDFILYIVEVQKVSNDNPDIITAGWIVARRFSQFFRLHEYLKTRYLEVANIKFPNRTVLVLKFQQKLIVEQRKSALEEYLQELIKMPQVCSNKAFRSFLSSENLTLRPNQDFNDNMTVNIRKSRMSVELVANKLYNGISNKWSQNSSTARNKTSTSDDDMMEHLKDMQNELRQFDEAGSPANEAKPVFVKPICDLLISVFRLNTSQSWLRGRALLVILQQIFGNTLEKKVYETVNHHLRTEENILDLLILLKNTVFPMGKLMPPPEKRSPYQKSTTKQEARVLLDVFMNETCSTIFGLANTTYANHNIFKMLQNGFLNRHLIMKIFDEILDNMFPELTTCIPA